jgi:hypothetical protein
LTCERLATLDSCSSCIRRNELTGHGIRVVAALGWQ